MPTIVSAFASGLIFGLGLIVSQMVNPAKVLAFLDVFGDWDPSLALVMGSAVAVSALGYAAIRRRALPLIATQSRIPTNRDLDPRLITGAAIFGVGWGLAGFCPGPALTVLPVGPWQVMVFVAAMLAGMVLFHAIPSSWPQMSFRRNVSSVDG